MSQDSSSSSKPGKASPQKVDPKVEAKPERRQVSAEYKRRILEEVDACTEPGQIGALLRREGSIRRTSPIGVSRCPKAL